MSEIIPLTWTEARIAELQSYAAEGLSAAQIAHRMKPITELAIIGRAARLGIALGVKPPKVSAQRRSRQREEVDETHVMFGAAPPAREDAWIPLPGTLPVPLLDLKADQCPWPIGGEDDGGTYAHCGCDKPADLPYCRDHTALAYENRRYRRPRGVTLEYIRSNERRYA